MLDHLSSIALYITTIPITFQSFAVLSEHWPEIRPFHQAVPANLSSQALLRLHSLKSPTYLTSKLIKISFRFTDFSIGSLILIIAKCYA